MTASNWISTGKSSFSLAAAIAVLILAALLGSPVRGQSNLEVHRIAFSGNTFVPDKALSDIIKARKGESFNAKNLRLDPILISNYYQMQGFVRVYVTGDFERNGDRVTITYTIREGQRYYLKEIRFNGNRLISDGAARDRFDIEAGDPFSRQKIEAGINLLENFYLDNGKPYVVFSDTTVFQEDSLISVRLRIDEGNTVYIRDITYSGLDLVKSFLLRRELEVKRGTIYSRSRLEASQRNIYSTGLFKSVSYHLQPINADATVVQLNWKVVEKKPLWLGLRFGVGFEDAQARGNLTTFDLTAETGHRNLFGTARSVSLQVTPSFFYGREVNEQSPLRFSNPKNEIAFTFVEPWVLNTRTPGVLKISYSDERPPVSIRPLTSFSGSFNLTSNYKDEWGFTAGASVERVRIADNGTVTVQDPGLGRLENLNPGEDIIYSLRYNPIIDRRDNVLNPQRGYLTEARNTLLYSSSRLQIVANGTLTDTTATNVIYKSTFTWNRYQRAPIYRSWVLATRVRGSALINLGTNNDIRLIPPTERYYLGGASTIRGYPEQGIGRQDVLETSGGEQLAVPVGGKYVLLLNAELRIPLFWLFYGETFIDAGNLWESFSDFKDPGLKVSSGLGLALLTPFGPIRFDYGVKWFPEDGENLGEFHIGIAFAF